MPDYTATYWKHLVTCGKEKERTRSGRHLDLDLVDFFGFFVKGALFRCKGGPPVLEEPARHILHQGRGFVRPPVCPTPPAVRSAYGGQLTDCWHRISSCGQ